MRLRGEFDLAGAPTVTERLRSLANDWGVLEGQHESLVHDRPAAGSALTLERLIPRGRVSAGSAVATVAWRPKTAAASAR